MIKLPVQSAHAERVDDERKERKLRKNSEQKILSLTKKERVWNPFRESVNELIYVSSSFGTREIESNVVKSSSRVANQSTECIGQIGLMFTWIPLHICLQLHYEINSDQRLEGKLIKLEQIIMDAIYALCSQAQAVRPRASNEPSKFTSNDMNSWLRRWKLRESTEERD